MTCLQLLCKQYHINPINSLACARWLCAHKHFELFFFFNGFRWLKANHSWNPLAWKVMNNCYIDTEAIPIQDKEMSKQKACVAGSVSVSQYRLTTLFTVKQECNNKSRSGAKPQRALFILEKKNKKLVKQNYRYGLYSFMFSFHIHVWTSRECPWQAPPFSAITLKYLFISSVFEDGLLLRQDWPFNMAVCQNITQERV